MSVESPSSSNGAHTNVSNLIKGYQNETLNPYFTHSNENYALVLVTSLLNTQNYHSWSMPMTMAFRSKNKLYFINGNLPRPPDEDRDSTPEIVATP